MSSRAACAHIAARRANPATRPRGNDSVRYAAMPPPSGTPPILLNLDYAAEPPPLPDVPGTDLTYDRGQLRLSIGQPDANQGIAADQTIFRDVIIQAQISLAEGDEDDLYGIFVRSPRPDLYYAFAISPAGHVVISRFDGRYDALVAGPLAPDMPFNMGLRQSNRLQVVALGPGLTFLLNDVVVSTETVEEETQEGYLGFYLHHGPSSARATLAVDWIQVRGIFPEGEHR